MAAVGAAVSEAGAAPEAASAAAAVEAGRVLKLRQTTGFLYLSGAAITDCDFLVLDDDRYLSGAFGVTQHFLHSCGVFLDVHIGCAITIGRPGLGRIGSPVLPEDDHFLFHE